MPREIKFRAWDKTQHIMSRTFEFGGNFAAFPYPPPCRGDYMIGLDQVSVGEFQVMQYAGMKDESGKEIFEGDIVLKRGESSDDDSKMPVEWMTCHSGFCRVFTDIDGKLYGIGLGQSDVRTLEVIGNIFENPELLNPAASDQTPSDGETRDNGVLSDNTLQRNA
jgi:hypothetical protein